MGELWTTLLAAVIAFAATNIDDIFLLTLYFSQVNGSFRKRHIILGQYLGFAGILAVSALGFFGALVIPEPIIGLLGIAPIFMGIRRLLRRDVDEEIDTPPVKSDSSFAPIFSPQTMTVALVTFANGGDNISIYIPLFAGKTPSEIGVMVGTFAVLLALWCYLGYRLGSYPALGRLLERYGHLIVPFVLIGLGIYILAESGTFALIGDLVK